MTQVLALIISLFILVGQMDNEATIQKLIQKQAQAWQQENVASIVEDFAPDAVFIAGGNTRRGIEAIQESAEDYFRQFTDIQITIKRVIIQDNQAAVEWDWSDRGRKTGQQSTAEDAIIFALTDDSKIIYWREYIETKQIHDRR